MSLTEFLDALTGDVFPPEDNATRDDYKLAEELDKELALIILNGIPRRGKIIVPSADEWIDLSLLERDDQLPERSSDNGNANRLGTR